MSDVDLFIYQNYRRETSRKSRASESSSYIQRFTCLSLWRSNHSVITGSVDVYTVITVSLLINNSTFNWSYGEKSPMGGRRTRNSSELLTSRADFCFCFFFRFKFQDAEIHSYLNPGKVTGNNNYRACLGVKFTSGYELL